MTKTLIVGFSVTEMVNSYVPRLRTLIATRRSEIKIDHCGIGGITTEALPYFIDRILAGRPDAERVVFEIATSYVRTIYAQHIAFSKDYHAEIWAHIEQLVFAAWRSGKDVAFVNLPRIDVDYHADLLESIIAQVCAVHDVPLLSISLELLMRDIALSQVLLDEVHPNPAGAELYAEKVLGFLERLGPACVRCADVMQKPRYSSIALADKIEGDIVPFSRHGFRDDYVVLKGGDSVKVQFERPTLIEGFAVLAGPRSATLTITTDTPHSFLCYDQHCYYERMMTSVLALGWAEEITLSLALDVPAVELLKGTKDVGPRQIGFFYLLTRNS